MRKAVGKYHAGLKAPHPPNLRAPHQTAFRRAFYSSRAAYICPATPHTSSDQANDQRIRSNTESTATRSNCDRYNDRLAREGETRGFHLRYWRVTGTKNPSAIEAWSHKLQQKFRSHGQVGIAESWQNLKDQKLDLPMVGSKAHSVWSTLVVNLN